MNWRRELKYLVDATTRIRLDPILETRLVRGEFLDEDGSYQVLSQYYDGPTLPFYMDKVAGVESRAKVRLRTYGTRFTKEVPRFLEIKRRENNSISKIRAKAGEELYPIDPRTWDLLSPEARTPFVAAREMEHLIPTAQVWYQRAVLEGPGGGLRVTWDTNVRALYPGEEMTRDRLYDSRRAVIPDYQAVLEIKVAQTVPRWLTALIGESNLVSQSVSKYVQAMNVLRLSRKVLSTC